MPLGADDALSGVLLAVRAAGSPAFGEDDLELACTFADQAALAVQRAESLAAQRELRVLADWDRIARDLHEHVIGRLSGIGLTLHGSLHLATPPVGAARIAEHIEHLNGHHRGPRRGRRPARRTGRHPTARWPAA